ncbi:uncharacterized protein LOC135398213 [Ornithodoros turicata]|uniref:uncharacterized protein LOC135398213 n=1 Tax=Ornithodoros turicata TaxID=34597 RepID=UPI00313A4824
MISHRGFTSSHGRKGNDSVLKDNIRDVDRSDRETMHATFVVALQLAVTQAASAWTFTQNDSIPDCSLRPVQVCRLSHRHAYAPRLYVYDADVRRCWQMVACKEVCPHAYLEWLHCRRAHEHCGQNARPTVTALSTRATAPPGAPKTTTVASIATTEKVEKAKKKQRKKKKEKQQNDEKTKKPKDKKPKKKKSSKGKD